MYNTFADVVIVAHSISDSLSAEIFVEYLQGEVHGN